MFYQPPSPRSGIWPAVIELREASFDQISDAAELTHDVFIRACCFRWIIEADMHAGLHLPLNLDKVLLGIVTNRNNEIPWLVHIFRDIVRRMITDVYSDPFITCTAFWVDTQLVWTPAERTYRVGSIACRNPWAIWLRQLLPVQSTRILTGVVCVSCAESFILKGNKADWRSLSDKVQFFFMMI